MKFSGLVAFASLTLALSAPDAGHTQSADSPLPETFDGVVFTWTPTQTLGGHDAVSAPDGPEDATELVSPPQDTRGRDPRETIGSDDHGTAPLVWTPVETREPASQPPSDALGGAGTETPDTIGYSWTPERQVAPEEPVSADTRAMPQDTPDQRGFMRSNVNVRLAPGTEHPVQGVALRAEAVRIMGRARDTEGDLWLQVETATTGLRGFVFHTFVVARVAEVDPPVSLEVAYLQGNSNLRAGPGTVNDVVIVAERGTELGVLRETEDADGDIWVEVTLDGITEQIFVFSGLLGPEPPADPVPSVDPANASTTSAQGTSRYALPRSLRAAPSGGISRMNVCAWGRSRYDVRFIYRSSTGFLGGTTNLAQAAVPTDAAWRRCYIFDNPCVATGYVGDRFHIGAGRNVTEAIAALQARYRNNTLAAGCR